MRPEQAGVPGDVLVGIAPEDVRVEHLTPGYRITAPLLRYANRLLPAIGVEVRESQSVRVGGGEPVILEAGDLRDVRGQVVDVVASLVEFTDGSVAVIAASEALDGLGERLDDAGCPVSEATSARSTTPGASCPTTICSGTRSGTAPPSRRSARPGTTAPSESD